MVKRILSGGMTLFLLLSALAVVSPVLLTLVFSLEDGVSAYVDFYVWQPRYLQALANSLCISLTASFGSILVSVMAAYVFAKVKFRGRDLLFYLYIIVMMMPFQVTLLPQYIVSRDLSLYDTQWALICPGIFAPFAVFLLTQVTKTVPDEMLEAARLETGSTWRILLSIIIPQIRPGIICAWVLVFTEQWNAVAEPLILMETREKYPLAVMLNDLSAGDALGFAATVIFFAAPLLLFAYFEDEILEGLGDYRLK